MVILRHKQLWESGAGAQAASGPDCALFFAFSPRSLRHAEG